MTGAPLRSLNGAVPARRMPYGVVAGAGLGRSLAALQYEFDRTVARSVLAGAQAHRRKARSRTTCHCPSGEDSLP